MGTMNIQDALAKLRPAATVMHSYEWDFVLSYIDELHDQIRQLQEEVLDLVSMNESLHEAYLDEEE